LAVKDATVPASNPDPGLLARIGRGVDKVEGSVVLSCVVLVVVSVLWGVLTRYVSQKPAAWTGEVASIAFCWAGFVGAALIYAGNFHPRIFDSTTIASALPRRVLGFLSLALEVVVLLVAGVLAIKQIGINMTNPTAVLRLPGSIYYLPVAWFSVSSLARLVARR
jgi:TRAP-type C4-dicarboxylate transport system permease small subunit